MCGCCSGQPISRRKLVFSGVAAAIGAGAAMPAPAGEVYRDFWSRPRAIKLYRKETGERGEFEYWRDGRYQMAGWYALLHLLRDVRAGVAMHYDPRVVNLVWAVQEWCWRDSGRRFMFRLTDGARTNETNAEIPGAAPESTHKRGEAVDGSFEGLGLRNYADAARFFGVGGVGLYEKHVHVDCAGVRKWGF